MQCIDLFALRILSLLICRGKPNDKAIFLLVLGELEYGEDIDGDNQRIKHALKIMMDMTGFLPQKFLSVNKGT